MVSKKQRANHEAECAAMRKRVTDQRLTLWRAGNALYQERERKEKNGFDRMGRYLDRQARQAAAELAAERRYNAFYAIPTSWAAIERAGLYSVWRRRDSLVTRQRNSLRPAWGGRAPLLNFPLPSQDRHHLGFRAPLERAA